MWVHLAERHASTGTISVHKNVYFLYEDRVADFGICLSLLLSILQIGKIKKKAFSFQSARKWIKGSVSGDPTFSKANKAHNEKIRMEKFLWVR